MVLGDRPSGFQEGQRVRVRKVGRDSDSQPEEQLLGKEGNIWYGSGSDERGFITLYFVEFDGGAVVAISPGWLESAE